MGRALPTDGGTPAVATAMPMATAVAMPMATATAMPMAATTGTPDGRAAREPLDAPEDRDRSFADKHGRQIFALVAFIFAGVVISQLLPDFD